MIEAILYGTVGCHLCEQAAALLAPWVQSGRLIVHEVDIADDDFLLERYGVRIPVLRIEHSDQELGWPFDADTLSEFLRHA